MSASRLLVRHFFDVPRERLFRAWTEPAEMQRWFSPIGFTNTGVEADVRPGGRYRIGMSPPDGSVFFAHGEYVEVSSPQRLVFTWAWEGNPLAGPNETLVTVEFHESGSGTELLLIHELLPDEEARARHEHGWSACFEHLQVALSVG